MVQYQMEVEENPQLTVHGIPYLYGKVAAEYKADKENYAFIHLKK